MSSVEEEEFYGEDGLVTDRKPDLADTPEEVSEEEPKSEKKPESRVKDQYVNTEEDDS